jgi:hypothetical protein
MDDHAYTTSRGPEPSVDAVRSAPAVWTIRACALLVASSRAPGVVGGVASGRPA